MAYTVLSDYFDHIIDEAGYYSDGRPKQMEELHQGDTSDLADVAPERVELLISLGALEKSGEKKEQQQAAEQKEAEPPSEEELAAARATPEVQGAIAKSQQDVESASAVAGRPLAPDAWDEVEKLASKGEKGEPKSESNNETHKAEGATKKAT
jgi:hypothetical protein